MENEALLRRLAASVPYSAWCMLATGLLALAYTRGRASPYGRHNDEKAHTHARSAQWAAKGPMVPAWLAWMLMESPNLWVTALVWRMATASPPSEFAEGAQSTTTRILLGMFIAHYVNRALIYPLRAGRGDAAAMPFSVMALAFSFCLWNGALQSSALLLTPATERPLWRVAAGAAIWLFGLLTNVHSDEVLLSLRRTRHLRKDGEKYAIPTGGMFRFVSAANYTGEIIEWAGFALACGSLPAVAFAVFTFANLAPRGESHHHWLQEKFRDYPRERRAVIPFLW